MNANLSLDERVDLLESRQALSELVAEFSDSLDKRDADRFVATWHPDGVWAISGQIGGVSGHEAIRHTLTEVFWKTFRETHHWAANLSITFDGPDRAIVASDAHAHAVDDHGRRLSIAATHRYACERRAGRWRIVRRESEVHHAWPAETD